MIHKLKEIPITENSHPFAAAAEKCGFEQNGYEEKEYFMYGTSNIYGWKDGKKETEYADAPYVNRLLVRKPKDMKTFSGNVVVEILNSTSYIDFDRVWVLTYRHLMRNKDVYIGITSKPNVLPAMYKLDDQRYQELHWDNPRNITYKLPDEELGNMEGASSPDTEDGLFWDMLTDLADLLRDSPETIIPGGKEHYQYLAGWSQSGGYMIRFLNTFAYEKEKTVPYFDGYFSCGGASTCMPDLNQGYGATGKELSRKLVSVRQPFVEMHTESENQKWGNYEARGNDSNNPSMKYRIYDIAGATHDSKGTMIDYYLGDSDVMKCGIIPNYPGKEIYPNDFPYEIAFQAALQSLYEWVRDGKEPVTEQPVEVDENYDNIVDEYGNAKGGWRLPFVTYPLCTYHPECTPMKPDFAFAAKLFGYVEMFSKEKAKKLYESKRHYLDIIEKEADRCILEKRMLFEDKEMCMLYCEELADKAGLI